MSIAGGFVRAVERGVDLGCTAIQIFVKNASQWRARPLGAAEAAAFRSAHRASGIGPLVAHSTYLINLAARHPAVRERSRALTGVELDRCAALGAGALIVHPGAHLGAGEERGLERVARSLDRVLAGRERQPVRLLLELTAGQGSLLGYRLEQLRRIIEMTDHPRKLGVCVDTCHAFAAGYALHTPDGYRAFWDELDAGLGRERLGAIHLNDSRAGLGSRRDRHANIGQGAIGLDTFARLLHDPALAAVPKIIETPSDDDFSGHRRDLEELRKLRRLAEGGPS